MSIANSSRISFPVRLHGLLTQAAKLGLDDIISWHSSGKKFIIYNQKDLVDKILPNIFKQSKFASFRRQMNAYGFERELNPDKTKEALASFLVYSHEHFIREDPSACRKIARGQRPPQNEKRSLFPEPKNTAATASSPTSSPSSSLKIDVQLATNHDWNLKSFLASSVNIAEFSLKNEPVKTTNAYETRSQDINDKILQIAQFSSGENIKQETNGGSMRTRRQQLNASLGLLFDDSIVYKGNKFTSSVDSSIQSHKMEEEQTCKADNIFQEHESGISRTACKTNTLSDTVLDELADTIFDVGLGRDCMNCWDPKEESLGQTSPLLSAF